MRYRIPTYYSQFRCIGGDCESTCCRGWNIPVDAHSYAAYMREQGSFGEELRHSLDHERRCFVQDDGGCLMLDQDGLCRIQKKLGHEGLCRACRTYPRHMEDYGELREVMLSLSCPEAARLILGDASQGEWRECTRKKARPEAERLLDPEPQRVRELLEIRRLFLCILKDRSVDWDGRLAMILAAAHDLQRGMRTEDGRDAARANERLIRAVSGRYLAKDAAARFGERLQPYRNRGRERRIRMAAWMRAAQELEPVLAHWHAKQGAVCTKLYHRLTQEEYDRLRADFEQEASGLEPQWENLMRYFLYAFVLGAVYDGDLYSKVKLAVFSCRIVREWCLYRFAVTGQVTEETLTAAAFRYSRELENSDYNMEELEKLLREDRQFSLEPMLAVLCG